MIFSDMKDYLLTFEIDEDGDQVYIHGDPAGLDYLAKSIQKLADQARAGEFPHDHLFSPEWGGEELTSEKQSQEGKLINHVKIYGWPDENGAEPYTKS